MEIKAFPGLRYNADVVGNVGDCIAPPYDVIDADLQQKLYERSDYNIVRIIRGKTESSDSDASNVYTRAADAFRNWLGQQALKADEGEHLYAYVQDFTVGETAYRRSGFVGLGKVEPFGAGVQPHEKTLDGPKADRLNLTRATEAQFGQIFMLYDDPANTEDEILARAAARPALIDFVDDGGVRHRLFDIADAKDIDTIRTLMQSRPTVIADGHHRYETALNYYNETKNPEAEWQLMTFVNMHNEGLIILPTHRLLSGLGDFDARNLLGQIFENFEVRHFAYADPEQKPKARGQMFQQMHDWFSHGRAALGFYANDGAFYALVLKDPAAMERYADQLSAPSRSLDVNVLHKLILEDLLGIGDAQLAGQTNLEYIKDIGEAVDQAVAAVDSGDAQAVFFMNPTRIEQVRAVAAAGEKMPQKSTFFHPKIYTGLVIHKL